MGYKFKYNIRKLKYFCFIYVYDISSLGNFKFFLKVIEWIVKSRKKYGNLICRGLLDIESLWRS